MSTHKTELYFESSHGNLVGAFPDLLDLYLSKTSGKHAARNKDILAKRFALEDAAYTLEEIGTYYDLTRERVRQIEAKALRNMDLLLSDKLKPKGLVIDAKLNESYLKIKKDLQSLDFILAASEVRTVLETAFGSCFDGGYFSLFMEVAGYIQLPTSIPGFRGSLKSCWCARTKYDRKELESIFASLDVVFDKVDSYSLFELTVKAKKRMGRQLSNDSIHVALKACKDIDVIDDLVSVRFHSLRSAADKAYRVLSAKSGAMHYSEIAREINMLNGSDPSSKSLKDTNLRNQLVSDSRFVPVGRSGEWGLSQWEDFNKLTIVESIESILHKAGEPLSNKAIMQEIRRLRPDAAENSVKVYLSTKLDKFVNVGNGLYGLTVWNMKGISPGKKAHRVSDDVFSAAIDRVMEDGSGVPFPLLLAAVRESTGLSESSIRQRIAGISHLKLETRKGHAHKFVLLNKREDDRVQPVKRLLRDQVQAEIRAILFANPNTPFQKVKLYKEVVKNVQCPRPTFYSYLREIRDVRTYKDGNGSYVIHDHKEVVKGVSIAIDKYKIDAALAKQLARPLSKLTIDDVDIALFELGRLFEEKLKGYLELAQSASILKVSSKDLSKLVNMIECVVREGIVTKGHHLHTLREERNSRAHGKTPTLDERTELFNKAHYIADLFVMYIALFERKLCELQERHLAPLDS